MVVSLAHPLDPLTADELSHAVDVFRGERGLGEETRFINLELDEPEKAELRAWRDGGAAPVPAATTWATIPGSAAVVIASIATTSFDGGQEGAFKGRMEFVFNWFKDGGMDPTAALRLTDTIFMGSCFAGVGLIYCSGWVTASRDPCSKNCASASPTR